MSGVDPCADAGFIASVDGHDAIPTLIRLLARGAPLDLDTIAAATGRDASQVTRLLREQPGTDWDDDGRLVGFGLTQRETPHRYRVDGRDLFTWCAGDTLLFTAILGQHARVASTCPATGTPIRLDLHPNGTLVAEPAATVLTQRLDPSLVGDLRAQVCDHGHFYASRDAAAGWADTHPDGQVLNVAEAFTRAQQTIATLGWLPHPTNRS